LTIAPVFFTAAIYICFTRIIVLYGTENALFRPKTYMILFITSDIFSLVLQAVGGAIADTANTHSLVMTGIHLMVAGLAFQVFSLAVFALLCAHYAWRVHKNGNRPQGFVSSEGKLRLFLWSKSLTSSGSFVG
jgi:hypothetical protein